jgi:prolyl-tRNA synthetase
MGTSHLLSQSFAHAFEMKFQDRNSTYSYPFLTSWGATTRLVGALIMVHGDQKGLIIPPKVAPIQAVIVPIFKNEEDKKLVMDVAQTLQITFKKAGIRIHIDDTDKSPGAKFYKWELKGVPFRIEIGPRDLAHNQVTVVSRLSSEKKIVTVDALANELPVMLEQLQNALFEHALHKQQQMIKTAHKLADFGPILEQENGAYKTSWCGNNACENELKKYKASIRCILDEQIFDSCFYCDSTAQHTVLIAKSY